MKKKFSIFCLILSGIILILTTTGCSPTTKIPFNSLEQEEQILESVENQTEDTKQGNIKQEVIEQKEDLAAEIKNDEIQPTKEEKLLASLFLVTRVIDGDTIEIEGGQKVRYIGIDTPETVDPRKPVQCFGVEASNRNKQLVDGKRVRLEKDISETDKYGRLLRYVYIDNIFVNLALVQGGFAYSSTYPPDVKYQNQFLEAERLAREQKIGLWSACPITTPSVPVTSVPAQEPPVNCTIKGNISSSNEKIYHLEGCDSYNVTKIDEARGEQWFCTEAEAVAAGWRKAKNCP